MVRRSFLKVCAAELFAGRAALSAPSELSCDVAIIGGGVGGVAAALAASRNGLRVVLTEETDWIGGQLTSQAVPPDEHRWIERHGATAAYRAYRNAVREYYRRHYPLTQAARDNAYLNPGNGSVSALTHEPRVSVAVLEQMLEAFVQRGALTILRRHLPVASDLNKPDSIGSVTARNLETGGRVAIVAKYFIDATETGELLPLTKTEFVSGAESRAQTGELHAASEPQPANVQSFTYCFALDYLEGEDHAIEKPAAYGFWRDYVPALEPPWTGKLLSWLCPDPKTLARRQLYFDPRASAAGHGLNLWLYRRILDPSNFTRGSYPSGITLVNWPQNDFWLGDLLSADEIGRQKFLDRAKQLSLSWLYWMQTEAPRSDGKEGWKGLRLRKDVVGTDDGLAKAPYIRESRRMRAEFTVLEQHVGLAARAHLFAKGAPPEAEAFPDSVGIGYYRLDLHPSTGGNNYIDVASLRFQIPLGALIPQRMENLLAGCKNLGVTHITNGCYRLHPVEWNIGEAAGAVAAHAIQSGQTPRSIRKSPAKLRGLQRLLAAQGFELTWSVAR
jgi:hypothetical protein